MHSGMAAAGNSLWSKNFIFLSVSNAFLSSGFHSLFPTLPLYIARNGGSDAAIGLVMGSFTFSAILIRLFTAEGINRLGKKRFLLTGISICLFSMACYYWATNVVFSFLARIVHGIGFGIATTMFATLVSDLVPAARRGEGMGYFGLGMTLMAALAPAFAVWVVGRHGFGALFILAVCTQAIALIWTLNCSIPAEADAVAKTAPVSRGLDKKMLLPAFLSLLLGMCMGGVLSFVTLLAKEIQIANAGYFFLTATSSIFAARLVSGRVFDRMGHAWVIIPAAVILLAGFSLLSQVSSPAIFLTAAVCYGLGIGTLFPSLQAWMINLSPAERRGAANATFFNSLDLGVGGGSVVLGLLAQLAGYRSIYLTLAVVAIVFIGFYTFFQRKNTNKADA